MMLVKELEKEKEKEKKKENEGARARENNKCPAALLREA
jgi:hypothetical protein